MPSKGQMRSTGSMYQKVQQATKGQDRDGAENEVPQISFFLVAGSRETPFTHECHTGLDGAVSGGEHASLNPSKRY